ELEVALTVASTGKPLLLAPTGRLLHMQKLPAEDRDIGEFTTLDRMLHLSPFLAAGARQRWHRISGRSGHIDRLRRLALPAPGKIVEVIGHHEDILAAIASGDRRSVDNAVRTHLSGTLAALDRIVEKYPQYF